MLHLINQDKKAVFYTLGCRANQYQSASLKCQMTNDQCQMVDFGKQADIYIINTCTVTADADRKSRQAIRRALRLSQKVLVAGCLARLQGKKLKEMFPSIEIIDTPFYPNHPTTSQIKIRMNLMIEDGCENFCSYCIVPYARGKVKSKPVADILKEAQSLIDAGARELVLTGINLGAWGKISVLLPKISDLPGSLRVRLSSIEPQYVTDELIDTIAGSPKICQHLHIPLQSGDDQVLRAMNRKYSAKEYEGLIARIRNKIPDCGISTDVIAGFPGEGEKEFQNTVNLIEKLRFSRLHLFPYSARDLTAASKFPDQIDPQTKKHRFKVLDQIKKKQMKAFAEKYLGKEVEILVEQKGEGLTSNYIRVKFDDRHNMIGQLHKLVLTTENIKP